MRKFRVYARQSTNYTAIVEANSLAEANERLMEEGLDWEESDDGYDWINLPHKTEDINDTKRINRIIINLLDSARINKEELDHGRYCSSLSDLDMYLNVLGASILKEGRDPLVLAVLAQCFSMAKIEESSSPVFKKIIKALNELDC